MNSSFTSSDTNGAAKSAGPSAHDTSTARQDLGQTPVEHRLRSDRAEATFTPSEGMNCTSFRVRLPSGDWLPALAEAPNWDALTARPSFYGNPLLFPFAYGVAGSTLRTRTGAEHTLQPTRWARVAHGLVRDCAWTVEREWEDGDGAHLRASIVTQGQPARLAEYPFPFRLTATYTLLDAALTLAVEAENLGDEPMPFGFGIHPYLPAPLGGPGQPLPEGAPAAAQEDVVWCDGALYSADGPTPAGQEPPHLAPVEGAFDLRGNAAGTSTHQEAGAGSARGGQTFRALLDAQRTRRDRGGLFMIYAKDAEAAQASGRGLCWSVTSPSLGATVEIETTPNLWAMVLFAPAEPTPIISPVIGTCLPGFLDYPDDPERAQALGYQELAPRATWSATATIRVRA